MSLTLGALIREARDRAGFTRAELARRARTSPAAVARYETGRASPKMETAKRCIQACGFDLRVELVHASPQRQAAADAAFARSTAQVGLPWPSLLGFVRLVSNPRIFERPSSIMAAWWQVESWLTADSTWIPLPTERHREVLGPLMKNAEGRANLVPDAHIAALAVEHGLVLHSTDGDFARFDGLDWINPLK